MHDTFFVQFADGYDDLGRVEFDNILAKTFLLLENFVKFTTIDERHYEIKPSLRLEQVLHTAKERVVSFEKNVFFKGSWSNLVILDEYILTDSLDGIFFTSCGK